MTFNMLSQYRSVMKQPPSTFSGEAFKYLAQISDAINGLSSQHSGLVVGLPFTAPQIGALQHNYNPTGGIAASMWRLSSDASRTITGISSLQSGEQKWLINVGTQDINIANQNAGSLATARVITGTGATVTLGADDTCLLWYDAVTGRVRILT